MITTTFNEINNTAPIFQKILHMELNINTTIEVVKLIKKLDKIIEEYNDKLVKIRDENKEDEKDLEQKIQDLVLETIEIEDIDKINLNDEDIKLSPMDYMSISNFIVEE